MLDYMATDWGRGSFEDNILPQLVYICPIQLDEEGQEMHSHAEHAELMLVQEGAGAAVVDGRREELEAGDFVLCGAGEPHRYYAQGIAPLRGISCGFTHLLCRGMEENHFVAHHDPVVVHTGAGSRVLADILTVLERAAVDPGMQNEELCIYLSAAAVTTALQLHRTAAERAEQAHYSLGVRTRMYLDRHYLEPLTLDQLAQAMGVSKYHLDRVFLATVGCTPVQYITRRRMARAQTLLGSTRQSVQRIAAQCGYSNYNYFTALFRRTVGMTPGEYRKLAQGRTNRRG